MSTSPLTSFSQDWFSRSIPCWDLILKKLSHGGTVPLRVLEVGCFEGRSTCWLLQNHCIDSRSSITVIDNFLGGAEHGKMDLSGLQKIFQNNVTSLKSETIVRVMKGYSYKALCKLIADGEENPGFDFISIDASHQAPDVLLDCVLAFQLLKRGGVMALDDYLWSSDHSGGVDILTSPKIAIDTFTNIYRRQSRVIPNLPLYQLYLQKI